MTPAKITEVVGKMTVLEMMMAVTKMRARLTPANQCHVTNLKDNPVQIAADAAEAALRGFAEQETTVGIVRYAPFNAIAFMVGAQVGRPGILTQCAVEEATELNLGMRGFTAYAETVSVYGTEPVFMDGDDTPWSKAFLASCYASRGLKMRFTSGTGSEVQMGYAEGKSMLYLEARCLYITKAAGSQGIQNGSVSCVGVPAARPGWYSRDPGREPDRDGARPGVRVVQRPDLHPLRPAPCRPVADAVRARHRLHLLRLLGHAELRQHVRRLQLGRRRLRRLGDHPARPQDRRRPACRSLEADVVAIRNKAAKVIQALFRELGLTEITDAEVEAATYARGIQDMPDRNVVEDLKAAEDLMKRGLTGVDIVKALAKAGFEDVAEAVFGILKQKVAGDYLHTSAILDPRLRGHLARSTQPNDYRGPQTGYQISDEKWAQLQNIRQAISPESI